MVLDAFGMVLGGPKALQPGTWSSFTRISCNFFFEAPTVVVVDTSSSECCPNKEPNLQSGGEKTVEGTSKKLSCQ